MTTEEDTLGSDYLSFEITTVQEPNGKWRVFVTHMLAPDWPTSLPLNPFELPAFTKRADAEALGVLIVWKALDNIQVRDPITRIFKEVDVLE